MSRRKVTTTAERLHSLHGGFLGGATVADAEEIVLHGVSYHDTGHLPPPLPLPVCSEHPRKKTQRYLEEETGIGRRPMARGKRGRRGEQARALKVNAR